MDILRSHCSSENADSTLDCAHSPGDFYILTGCFAVCIAVAEEHQVLLQMTVICLWSTFRAIWPRNLRSVHVACTHLSHLLTLSRRLMACLIRHAAWILNSWSFMQMTVIVLHWSSNSCVEIVLLLRYGTSCRFGLRLEKATVTSVAFFTRLQADPAGSFQVHEGSSCNIFWTSPASTLFHETICVFPPLRWTPKTVYLYCKLRNL